MKKKEDDEKILKRLEMEESRILESLNQTILSEQREFSTMYTKNHFGKSKGNGEMLFSICKEMDLSRSQLEIHSSQKKKLRRDGLQSPKVNDYSNNEVLSSSTKNTSRKNAKYLFDKDKIKEEANDSADETSSYQFSQYQKHHQKKDSLRNMSQI